MCGKGTLLAEVATWWPSTRLIGVDVDPKQLQRCRENFQWLQREVSLHLANVTDDGLTALGTVDRVLVAPPWNKQFAVQGELQDFFERMFRAIFRVLKPDGKLVLLGSKGHVEKSLLTALGASQSHQVDHGDDKGHGVRWKVVARQRFALTPRTTATVLLVESCPLQDATPAARHLPWDRVSSAPPVERWQLARAEGFPRLVPANLGDAEPSTEWRQELSPKPSSQPGAGFDADRSVTWPQSNMPPLQIFASYDLVEGIRSSSRPAGRPSTPESARLAKVEKDRARDTKRTGGLSIPFHDQPPGTPWIVIGQ
eukprot:s12_g44.t1